MKAGKQTTNQKDQTVAAAPAAPPFAKTVWLTVALAVLAFIAYANTLGHGFALDDRATILGNPYVAKGVAGIPELFSTPYHPNSIQNLQSTHTGDRLYRPLALALYAIEKSVTNLDPTSGHLINALLFCGCVVLLFYFVLGLFGNSRAPLAFITAALFAVHPIHTEVVANLKSSDELLCFFMGILSLNMFIGFVQTGRTWRLAAGGISLLLALLSKETVVSFAVVIPFVFFVYKNETYSRSIAVTACALAAFAIWWGVRYMVFRQYDTYDPVLFMFNPLSGAPSVSARIATAFLVMGQYLRLLIAPYPLVCMYSYPAIPFASFGDFWVLLSCAAYLVMLFGAIWLLVRRPKSPLAFAAVFYLTTMALFSNLFVTIGAIMAERFLFFGSVGFCLAAATGIESMLDRSGNRSVNGLWRSRAAYVFVPVIGLYLTLTINRNSEWQNSLTVLTADVAKAPNDASLLYSLGNEYMSTVFAAETSPLGRQRALESGLSYMRQSLALYADNVVCHTDMQYAFVQLQQYDSAEIHGAAALRVAPDNQVALKNLGIACFGNKKYDKAIAAFRKGIQLAQWDMILYSNIAQCFNQTAQYDSVIAYCRMAIQQDAGYGKAYMDMAAAYARAGVRDSALKYQAIAQRYNPGFRL